METLRHGGPHISWGKLLTPIEEGMLVLLSGQNYVFHMPWLDMELGSTITIISLLVNLTLGMIKYMI